MTPRGTVIAALVAIEFAIIGEAGVALRSGWPASWSAQHAEAPTPSGPALVEGGPHRLFHASDHPMLSVDIGYCDLTILTSKASRIDVSVSASTTKGLFQAKSPITAREDGETIRVATAAERGWTAGDNRMVTVLVPRDTRVTVVNAGDIKADGLRADASFKSVGRGLIAIEDYDAPVLHLEAADGPILLHQIVAARLDATTKGGGVEGSALEVRDGNVESNGGVTLGFASWSNTLITAQTSKGRISVSGFSHAPSGAGDDGDADDTDSSSQTVRIGSGNGHLDVHSDDGNINLAKEG